MIARVLRVLLTILVVLLAAWLGWRLWQAYMDQPWTRDAVVQAQIAQINADVGGRVIDVYVKDNQKVAAGMVLFRIDPQRYRLALVNARAALANANAQLALRQEQAARRAHLPDDVVSAEARSDAVLQVRVARAQADAARARVGLAQYDLAHTQVRAPVAGIVSHLRLRVGDYAATGKPLMALVETGSYWVDGYFEQTRLQGVHAGDHVQVRLLGSAHAFPGLVESIAPAITDRESHTGERLIANVRASFNWVRLPARIPVRIQILRKPKDFPLTAGMLCSVVVERNQK